MSLLCSSAILWFPWCPPACPLESYDVPLATLWFPRCPSCVSLRFCHSHDVPCVSLEFPRRRPCDSMIPTMSPCVSLGIPRRPPCRIDLILNFNLFVVYFQLDFWIILKYFLVWFWKHFGVIWGGFCESFLGSIWDQNRKGDIVGIDFNLNFDFWSIFDRFWSQHGPHVGPKLAPSWSQVGAKLASKLISKL